MATCRIRSLAFVLGAFLAASCGSSGTSMAPLDLLPDGAGDVPSDVLGEVSGDLPAEVPDGIGDVVGDPGADVSSDLPADPGPEIVPFDPAIASALQAVLEDYVHFSGDPGIAFAIHVGDGRRWASQAGLADVVAGAPVTSTSQFRVGSNTKPIVATWILQLVQEGRIDLDAPLSDHLALPDAWKAITVRQAMGMRTGIPDYIGDMDTWAQVLGNPGQSFTPEEVLALVKDKPLAFEPGKGCAYSNTNYVLLGMLGETITGARAADELARRFFVPLGMKDTYLEMTGDPADRIVHGYMDMAILQPMLGLPAILEALMPAELFLPGTHIVDATTLLPPSLTWAAGSVVSRPDDLAVFQRALQGGQLLEPGLLAQMHEWHSCDLLGGKVDYGLGTMRYPAANGDFVGHGGLNFGFHVETFYWPEGDLAFCHMHNYLPAQTAAVTEQALGVALGADTTPWEACEVPEELGASDTGDRVLMRFKGPIAAAAGIGRAGMADFRLRLGAEDSRLNGIDRLGVYAGAREVVNGGKTFVVTVAYGPPGATAGVTMRTMMVYVDPGLPAKADDAGMAAAGLGTITPLLIDLYLEAGTLTPTKTCIVAVPDMARTGTAFFCDGKTTSMQAGSMLRFAAEIPLTSDPTAVSGFLAMLKVPACSCDDGTGTMGACPAP